MNRVKFGSHNYYNSIVVDYPTVVEVVVFVVVVVVLTLENLLGNCFIIPLASAFDIMLACWRTLSYAVMSAA